MYLGLLIGVQMLYGQIARTYRTYPDLLSSPPWFTPFNLPYSCRPFSEIFGRLIPSMLCISASFCAAHTQKLVEIIFFQPFSTFFVHFKPFYAWNKKMNKKGWKRMEKSISTSFKSWSKFTTLLCTYIPSLFLLFSDTAFNNSFILPHFSVSLYSVSLLMWSLWANAKVITLTEW